MSKPTSSLRRLIWLYFWLLLFEGALRKWLVPGLSNALLIVRDPVAIAIYFIAVRDGLFPRSGFIAWMFIVAVAEFLASFAGIGTLGVTLYGLRANFLHLPMVFVLPLVLRATDVERMGYVLLVLVVPMTLLAVVQFKEGPKSAWNVGAGWEVGGQLFAAAGKVRASGTFSFATGFATYLAMSTSFLLADLLGQRRYPHWLTFTALPGLILAVIVSGSRSAVISVAIVCGMFVIMSFHRASKLASTVRTVIFAIAAVAFLAWLTPVFQEGLAVHQERFEQGGGLKEGIFVRFGHEFVAGWEALFRAPFLGVGLGVGTNVGANLLRGYREFTLGEGEMQRVILESGALLGLSYLALRVALLFMVFGRSVVAYANGRALPLLLVAAGGLDLATGQFGQPTTLGFAVFVAGLALAGAGAAEKATSPSPLSASPLTIAAGRSPYAEWLHGSEGISNPP